MSEDTESTTNLATDLVERSLSTFVQGFLAAWLVFGEAGFDALFTIDNVKAGVAAGILSAGKGWLASRKGDGTASLAS